MGRNVNEVYPEALWKMKIMGIDFDSRNGPVKRIPGPVATTYTHPSERMLLDEERDANPFFHIFEGVWMLAGRNDVDWVAQFNSNITKYSDDGLTLHGAYGHRWRNHFARDQIVWLIHHLRNNPKSRRAVVQMFDPYVDQDWSGAEPRDIPCNTSIYFELVNGSLFMTVTCRSNDMIWGCYGANAVHMSMLQEYIANVLGTGVGNYVQFSNNFHIYKQHFDLLDHIAESVPYPPNVVDSHVPIVRSFNSADDTRQLKEWMDKPLLVYDCPFVVSVLTPMMKSWKFYKSGLKQESLQALEKIPDLEIRAACYGWLKRRKWKGTYE